MTTSRTGRSIGVALLVLAIGAPVSWGKATPPLNVDLTRDGNAAKMAVDKNVTSRTYNLGPTGMRGWVFTDGGAISAKSRQILVTHVEKGSPADGVVAVADVILGIDGKPFTADARRTFGEAIDAAEKKGFLNLTAWRGKARDVRIKLRVMGSYSATAPYDCTKSAKILEEGCRYIAEKKGYGRFDLGVLALLASGKDEYQATVREFVHAGIADKSVAELIARVEESDSPRGRAWNSGYGMLLVCEYYLATGDKTVLPYLRASTINVARGQGMYGTYGHGFSDRQSNGELHGYIPPYGALNQAGILCFITMGMAQEAGVKHAELTAALGRSERFFDYYVGKGTIPYGEHRPNHRSHDDNGKSGSAALAFALRGKPTAARFFAKMNVAGFKGREWGHTGPFFGFMWGMPGANVGGPKAVAAYFKQVRWQYDLARKWDGSFSYEWTGGAPDGSTYRGVMPTPIYMLSYALPLRQTHITGKNQNKDIWLSDRDISEAIASGHFDAASKSSPELVKSLNSWSPAERRMAAEELSKRPDADIQLLTKMAEGTDANARIGAILALGYLKERATPALPALTRLLRHQDRWVRVQAADALKAMGPAAMPAAGEMLKAVADKDESDLLEFGQGALAFALFYPGGAVAGSPGVLAKSIEGFDKEELLYPAVRTISRNPDGHARGCLRSTYALLTLEDVQKLAPEIVDSVNDMAPCNTMFSKGVMIAGVQLFARHKIREGLPLAVKLLKWDMHGRGYILSCAYEVIREYGGAAKEILPELRALQVDLEKRKRSSQEKKQLADCIAAIEKDEDVPELISIRKYISEEQIRRMSEPYRKLEMVTK